MNRFTPGLAAVCLYSLASSYSQAHFDFTPRVSDGRIVTGGHDDETGENVDVLRVGGYDFGETPEDPFNIGDPGFTTQGASAFAGGSSLRLGALPIDNAFLSYWDGTGPVAFAPAPAGVSLTLSKSAALTLTLTATSAVYTPGGSNSLLVGTFAGNGSLHEHLGSAISGPNDTVPDGAYVIAFGLSNPGTGVTASEPLYVVYNNNVSEADHDRAITAVDAAQVPEPAGLIGVALGGAALMRRTRRRG